MSHLNGFVMCKANLYVLWGDAYISGTEHYRKLKFSMQIYMIHINIKFEYCHASVILDVLYLEDIMFVGQFLKTIPQLCFFSKKNLV